MQYHIFLIGKMKLMLKNNIKKPKIKELFHSIGIINSKFLIITKKRVKITMVSIMCLKMMIKITVKGLIFFMGGNLNRRMNMMDSKLIRVNMLSKTKDISKEIKITITNKTIRIKTINSGIRQISKKRMKIPKNEY